MLLSCTSNNATNYGKGIEQNKDSNPQPTPTPKMPS